MPDWYADFERFGLALRSVRDNGGATMTVEESAAFRACCDLVIAHRRDAPPEVLERHARECASEHCLWPVSCRWPRVRRAREGAA